MRYANTLDTLPTAGSLATLLPISGLAGDTGVRVRVQSVGVSSDEAMLGEVQAEVLEAGVHDGTIYAAGQSATFYLSSMDEWA